MTTQEQSTIDLLTAQLSEAELQIQDLQEENAKLQQEMENLASDRDRVRIENKLAIEDAELVRSFKRTNYAPLIEEMFEKPAKKLRRQTLLMIVIAILLSMGSAYLLSGYLIVQNNQIMEAELSRLHNNLDLLQEKSSEDAARQETTSEVAPSTSTPHTDNETNPATAEQSRPASEEDTTEITQPAPQPLPQDQETATRIAQEADSIVNFVQSVEERKDFPKGYRTDKSKMTQLYMIVSQQAGDKNLHYQSYIDAMARLGVEESVRPKTVDEMAAIDKDFLHALFSAYLITSAKQTKGWRYRDEDRRFSTYYNNASPYQLGAWKIVNKNQDYSLLPKVFAANIQRVGQQLAFNDQLQNTLLPEGIYYLAYNEANKNNAVKNLFNNDTLINKDGSLYLNITQYPLPLKREAIHTVQKALADQGFIDENIINGTAGPKTAAAVKAYQEKNGLRSNGQIDLVLINSLGVNIDYGDLSIDTALNQ